MSTSRPPTGGPPRTDHPLPAGPDCPRVREELSVRHDGERAGGHPELEAHLADCPACRDFERDLGRLATGFGELRTLRPPRDLWAEIQRRAAAPCPTIAIPEPARDRIPRARRLWGLHLAAAGIGFLAVLGLGSLVRSTKGPRAPDRLDPLARITASLHEGGPAGTGFEQKLLQHLTQETER